MPPREPSAPFATASGAPVRRRVSNEIVQSLLRDIVTGVFARGARLPNEREMAQHFGVSQPTVREAVRALDAMGLIEVRHGSGAYVTGSSTQLVDMAFRTLLHLEDVSILDVLEIRSLLGQCSARRATSSAHEEDLRAIGAASARLVSLDDAADVRDVAQRVVRFQIELSRAAHNPLLFAIEAFLIDLMMQLQLAGRPKSLRAWKAFTLGFADDRARLVEALHTREETQVLEAMTRYLEHQQAAFIADRRLSAVKLSEVGSISSLLVAVDGAATLRGPEDQR